jgi:hypothetical protein
MKTKRQKVETVHLFANHLIEQKATSLFRRPSKDPPSTGVESAKVGEKIGQSLPTCLRVFQCPTFPAAGQLPRLAAFCSKK